FSCSLLFCSAISSVMPASSLSRGQSISTRTNLSFPPSLKASCWQTSSLSLMHHPHQSEPVHSTTRALVSPAALLEASSKLLVQPSPPAKAAARRPRVAAQTAANRCVVFIGRSGVATPIHSTSRQQRSRRSEFFRNYENSAPGSGGTSGSP